MEVNFKYKKPGKESPIYFEQIFAEKPGGGLIENPQNFVPASTAVGSLGNGKFGIIKSYRLVKAVAAADTTIQIAKNSGVAVGDVIAHGSVGVAATEVDTTNADFDVVTVTMGVDIPVGTSLYQAKEASADAAEPLLTPEYVTGNDIPGGEGDQAVRLVNGANLRKETAHISKEVAALIGTIKLV